MGLLEVAEIHDTEADAERSLAALA